jgi:hypothetical protein
MIPGDDFAAAFLTLRFAAFLVVVLATAGRDLVPDFFALVAALEPLVVVFFAAFFFEAFDAERDFVLVRLFVLTMFLSLKVVLGAFDKSNASPSLKKRCLLWTTSVATRAPQEARSKTRLQNEAVN